MPIINYKNYVPRPSIEALIFQSREILDRYSALGYTLSIRQLYYRLVHEGLLENEDRNYKLLSKAMIRARLGGLLSWTAISDRSWDTVVWKKIESDDAAVAGIGGEISYDFWDRQDYYIEVWIEKAAIAGVADKIGRKYRVPYTICNGYLSTSAMWVASGRFKDAIKRGKRCVILHVCDHDPTGFRMTADNQNRMSMFLGGDDVEVRRVALSKEQVNILKPPPNATCLKMPVTNIDYIKEHGKMSWEIEAIDPMDIERALSECIEKMIDKERWNYTKTLEEEGRVLLSALEDNWDSVREYIKEKYLKEKR